MKKAMLVGLVAALAAGLMGCTDSKTDAPVEAQRIELDGAEWQKVPFVEHIYTKEEVDRIIDDVEAKIPESAAETDPVWNAEKGNYATKDGYVATNHTGNVSIIGSVSEGSGGFRATGRFSHAEGAAVAFGRFAHAEGGWNVATGDFSHVEGGATAAYGSASHASGCNATALDACSFVWSGYDPKKWQPTLPITNYMSHGEGTFSVNPLGGATGFYIGETNLVDLINALIDARLNQ